MDGFSVRVASTEDTSYAHAISEAIRESASARGTGIAHRTPEYLARKMTEGKAVIALTSENALAGFCYMESWGHDKYVANSGLIVLPEFRHFGLARRIKEEAFELSRRRYPEAKLFGLTTSLAVMTINYDIGYRPVTFSELTSDDEFWAGCKSCVNHDILMKKERKNCLCTAMIFDPHRKKQPMIREATQHA